jgi:hypothetical protein
MRWHLLFHNADQFNVGSKRAYLLLQQRERAPDRVTDPPTPLRI